MKKRARNEITITGTTGDDLLIGTADPDTIDAGDGNDTLIGEGGADTLIGGTGNDAYRVEEAGDVVVEAVGGGSDAVYAVGSYTLGAGSEVELLSAIDPGSTVAINLIGNEFANLIIGTAGSNTLIGGGGADTLIGGAGNDFYRVEEAGDTVVEGAGGGFDSVYAVGSYTLATGSEVELLSAIDPASTAAMNLTGNEYANLIYGNAGVNVLIGGGGADTLLGGGGDDFYRVEEAGDTVVEAAGGGFDSVYAVGSYTLAAGSEVELLSAIDPGSTGAMNLVGNEFANRIYGTAGVNVLIGGGGADILFGGAGDDFYRVEEAGDIVVEAAGGGNDAVYAVASYTLAAGSEIELLSAIDPASTAGMNLIGNEYANRIYGNAGVNTLIGGGGADVLFGGAGNDFYRVEEAGDIVVETVGGGNDAVYAVASYTLAAGSEVELLSAIDPASTAAMNLTGNEFANLIYGNAAGNVLIGGGGADTLFGGGGDDFYRVEEAGDVVVEAVGGGNDAVYAVASYTLAAGSEVELLSAIDPASAGAMNLTGNEFANRIYGTAGANILDGKGGNDLLTGGAGADIFAFTTALGAGNVDTVADFAIGTDKLRLDAALFAGLGGLGTLNAGAFVVGAAAGDVNDRIVYNNATGQLFYDADGSGAGAAVQFATLSSGLALTASDFLVLGAVNHAPAITSGAAAQVAENSPASTIVYQVVANDPDGDPILYSLTGTDAGLLTIDGNGAVRLIASADFETKTTYSFNVVASDSQLSTSKAVTLTITDVNDSGSTPIINEAPAANDSVATAQAIDRGVFLVATNPNLPDDDLPSATIVGNLTSSTDRDFFSITLQAGEKLILDVDFSGGNLDTHLRVYGPNGVEIGANDDAGGLDPGSAPHPVYGHNTDSFFSFRAATSGTYYFSLEPFQDPQNPTSGTYEINVTVGPPATAAQLIEEDVQALISGSAWPTTAITYSFPDSASDYPAGFGDPDDPEPVSFQQFTAFQQQAVQQLLQHVSNVSVLTFQQLTGAADRDAKLRYAMTNATEAAHAYYPGGSEEAGSAWFNKTNFNTPTKGNYAWMGMLHETGHALGLKHGHEPPAISPDRDSLEYSVMTYRSFPGGEIEGGYKNETFGFPQTLMMYDIAALQKIYDGANWTFNSGDSTYTWSPTTGEMSINGTGQGAPGANRVFMTVWDGGGNDTYDLSAYSTGLTVDLRPGEWTSTTNTQTANLGQSHFARGNIANALLFEGNTASLIENAKGGSAGDTIIANQAANGLTGNGGADIFKWAASGDAGTGQQADHILDFLRGTDKIDLSAIDANPATGVDDAFAFIGTATFHNVAGEVRYDVTGGNAHVFADLDGNGVADMEIIVNNVPLLAGTDFTF
jgi:Ca2+-binding RTX toxin-like protein